ncbi:MAG: lanthionine synthetase LanC family protein [Polyangiaceae bacterium]
MLGRKVETGSEVDDEYVRVLAALGLDANVVVDGPWAHVHNPGAPSETRRTMGWKLHLSATPTGAERLLRAVAPYLARRAPFKFARSYDVLFALNEGGFGPTQVGKFMTVYPEPGDALETARTLLRLTRESFDGPSIITDIPLGGILYARHGSFASDLVRDRLGVFHVCGDEQGLTEDKYTVPFDPRDAVDNPFLDLLDGRASPIEGRELFGPGYLLLERLSATARGSTFLALALHVTPPRLCVLKQAREGCQVDREGRDRASRLLREATLLRELRGRLNVPEVIETFTHDGHTFLSLEHIAGRRLDATACFLELHGRSRERHATILKRFVEQVERLHLAGVVHLDLKPANAIVTEEGEVYLIDFETAQRLDDRLATPIPATTLGFCAPRAANWSPSPHDDTHACSATITTVLTGVAPSEWNTPGAAGRVAHMADVPPDVATDLLAPLEPAPLPSQHALSALKRALERASRTEQRKPTTLRHSTDDWLEEAVERSLDGLLDECMVDASSGLWLSEVSKRARMSRSRGDWELRRSANRGVAGPLYVLSTFLRLGYDTSGLRAQVERTLTWLEAEHHEPDLGMPGLHFGEAGVAVAITRAIGAGVADLSRCGAAIEKAFATPATTWPDLTHGAAGQGIAALVFARECAAPAGEDAARACAEHLCRNQDDDGAWPLPDGLEGLGGVRNTGLGHGTAGVLYFLASYLLTRPGCAPTQFSLRRGWEFMFANAHPTRGGYNWPVKPGSAEYAMRWCHGAPGIALALLHSYEATGDVELASWARRALAACPPVASRANVIQCCGLAGIAEAYLEGFRVLQDEEWLERALRIGKYVAAIAVRGDSGGWWWPTGERQEPTADLMVGCGGLAHLFLRLRHPDALGPPLGPPSARSRS